jgi:flagellar hook-basal body complex protein FliE
MAIEPIGFLPAAAKAAEAAAPGAAGDFGSWLASAMSRAQQDLVRADAGVQQLAAGETQSLHQVMIALEEARVGVQLLVQVRNRLLEAYQEVLRMQV